MDRILDITVGTTEVRLIGDPHVGRKFKSNVPLNRRGEREKIVLKALEGALQGSRAEYTIIMGDLFDRMVVPYSVILDTWKTLIDAPTKVVVIRGNHDASRDVLVRSAFDVLQELCARYDHITFVTDSMVIDNMAFFGWHPFKTAAAIVAEVDQKVDAAFGHWDLKSFGDTNTNIIPTELLAKITDRAYTGHIHKPEEFSKDGVTVTVTGSLQPYAHGEDAEEEWYVTMSLEEYEQTADEDLVSKYVRVILGDKDPVPEAVDCLGFTFKREGVLEEDISVDEASFDMMNLFRETFLEEGVPQDILDESLAKYNEQVMGSHDD